MKKYVTFLLCLLLSCTVHIRPQSSTTRLTEKASITLAVDVSKIPEKINIRGSIWVWPFNFGLKVYDVYLREAFAFGAQYSLIDFVDKVVVLDDVADSKKYQLIYVPEIVDFAVSPFMASRIVVKVKLLNSSGSVVFEKEITGESDRATSACMVGFVGTIVFQNLALESTIKSALEDYYEKLYQKIINDPSINSYFLKKTSVDSPLKEEALKEEALKEEKRTSEREAVIILTDGSRIVGTIVTQDARTVTVQTKYTRMVLNKDRIESISYK